MDRALQHGLLLTCLLILPAALSGSGQAGQPAQTTQADNKSSTEPRDALHKLQRERYRALKDVVARLQPLMEAGREDAVAGWRDFTIAMFHAEADLALDNAERTKVYERLVEFVSTYASHVERNADAGRATVLELAKARILVLDAQIELEKQRLAERVAK